MSDLVLPSPASLAPSAQDVLASVSRNELVNLLIVEHVRNVTAQADAEAASLSEMADALTTEAMCIYADVYTKVFAAAQETLAAMDAVMIPRVAKAAGAVLNLHAPERLGFASHGIVPKQSDDWHAQRHSGAYLSPGLHEVVWVELQRATEVPVYRQQEYTADSWSLLIQYEAGSAAPKHGPRFLHLDVAAPFEMPPLYTYVQMQRLYQEASARVSDLRASVDEKRWPVLERKALATLTQAALNGQGVEFDTQKLLAALR